MAINDALSLKAARLDAIANVKWFWGPEHSDLISMVSFTIAMRRHLIRFTSASFTSFRLAKFGWVPSADLRVQHMVMTQNSEFTEGARRLGPIFTRLFTKVHEILQRCSRLLYFPTLCPIVHAAFHLEDIRH